MYQAEYMGILRVGTDGVQTALEILEICDGKREREERKRREKTRAKLIVIRDGDSECDKDAGCSDAASLMLLL